MLPVRVMPPDFGDVAFAAGIRAEVAGWLFCCCRLFTGMAFPGDESCAAVVAYLGRALDQRDQTSFGADSKLLPGTGADGCRASAHPARDGGGGCHQVGAACGAE
ncbi:hypothetical protein DVU_1158 [Nitratidesulfovibrio vulgaris str. Hildenborough]|uniref:Uncharacterized protein n=1 Tax=Nitratidesulfovibrio vulgaris (strain ATCC 29579 / DSM 644 / CCUG 34227 / NCIMB 8303 / VKM B-1760 / Hildenborough) TaxID=882 RepID=Q72CX5_NITV2|nr:hypothetical protein DVU_1158 [Nitratidesulfovibrio vulgaris str. Hildenborough]